mmetsp:Transcript_75354/g.157018  ORF Transcript_75354/g.157018 Transcript_75354/m.157018 type:complete len:332 (+) Transcript_75354:134-1129(+)
MLLQGDYPADVEAVEARSSGVSGCRGSRVCTPGCPSPAPKRSDGPGTVCMASSCQPEQYRYVGEGAGQYSPVDQYVSVGPGAGDYQKQMKPIVRNFRLRKIWIYAIALTLAIAFIYLLYYLFGGAVISNAESFTQGRATDHDCNKEYATWQTAWSTDKQDWCCLHYRLGCSDFLPADVEFDCTMNEAAWENTWSMAKKDWCCTHKGVHCEALPTPAVPQPVVPAPSQAPLPVPAPAPVPVTATPTPAPPPPAVPIPAPTPPATPSPPAGGSGCEAVCVLKGWAATCRSRVGWSMEHDFKASGAQSCRLSLGQVQTECSQCSTCTLSDIGCS